jgi:PhnB protein
VFGVRIVEGVEHVRHEERTMTGPAKAIPEEYRGATPYLAVHDAARAIEFYRHAFGAIELLRLTDAHGKIGHAEIAIGQARILLSDEYPDRGMSAPAALGGSAVSLLLYVEDVDQVVHQASAAGARVLAPLADHFYGDRNAKLEDPFGHVWLIATHKEDVSPDEMRKRASVMLNS